MAAIKPDIVLIPGSGHGQTSMRFLRSGLEARGYTVHSPVMLCVNCEPPTKTLLDDIGVIKSTVEGIIKDGRNVVIAAHSAGSFTASGAVVGLEKKAGSNKPGVAAVVFMSGMLVPKGGTSSRDAFGQPPFEKVEGDYVTLNQDDFPDFIEKVMYSDVPPDLTRQEVATFKHMPLGFFDTKVPAVPWTESKTTLPVTYISFTEDQLFSPDVQKSMYSAIPGVQVKEVKAGHMGVLSQPDKTAEAIDEIIRDL